VEIIRSTMDVHTTKDVETLEDALEADRWGREKAESLVVALAR
jgi:1-deoxy-D-xylulose-5-phosphate reductoisomerase